MLVGTIACALLFTIGTVQSVHAAPTNTSAPTAAAQSNPATTATVPAAARTLPDYGGRDGIAGTTYAAPAASGVSPLAQAGRAFEALIIVLALVIGGLYLLKRSGLVGAGGSSSADTPKPPPLLSALSGLWKGVKPAADTAAPAPSWATVIGSQPLPGTPGATLHLVRVGDKTLLLGATAHAVSLLSEGDAALATSAPVLDTGHAPFSFDGYLAQAETYPPRPVSETEMLLSATTMRLQAMISRSEGHGAVVRP